MVHQFCCNFEWSSISMFGMYNGMGNNPAMSCPVVMLQAKPRQRHIQSHVISSTESTEVVAQTTL